MEMITAIVQTSGLIIVVVTVISGLFNYYRKAKRDNKRRLELAIINNMIYSCDEKVENAPHKIRTFHCDYKALGGNGITDEIVNTIKCDNKLVICDTGTITSWEPTPKVIRPHHCECCGAPMPKGTTKCEYCGTEYY